MIQVVSSPSTIGYANFYLEKEKSGYNTTPDMKSKDDIFTSTLLDSLFASYNRGEMQLKELVNTVNSKCNRDSVTRCMNDLVDSTSKELSGIIAKKNNIDLELVKKYNNLLYVASYL